MARRPVHSGKEQGEGGSSNHSPATGHVTRRCHGQEACTVYNSVSDKDKRDAVPQNLSAKTIEEGFIQSRRQRSSLLFVGKN